MERSLYGPDGFFTRAGAEGPTGHFRTSVTASPLFAQGIGRLLRMVDAALGAPPRLDVVDIGAGRGELLTGILGGAPPDLAARMNPVAVERARRPPGLPDAIRWAARPPETITGLLLATEWLDNVPLDIAVLAADGPRYVLVDAAGAERPGLPVEPEDAAWLAEWWSLPEAGVRAEIGRPRDEAWAETVGTLVRGLAVAVDYGHLRDGRPPLGTLTGYRLGRNVPPVPDGSGDLTAHVAMDAVAAASARVAGRRPVLDTQRSALRQLGVDGGRPRLALASADPAGYLRRLARATAAAELTDPAGLGAHLWLIQPVGIDWPPERSGTGPEPPRGSLRDWCPDRPRSGWKEH